MSNKSLLDQAWDQLKIHAKGTDTPQQTLQRLLIQHCRMHFEHSLDHALKNGTLKATSETRTTAELDKLWRVHDRARPKKSNLPPVILRIGDYEFIIDGNTRINKRVGDNAQGPHDVIIVEVTQVVGAGDAVSNAHCLYLVWGATEGLFATRTFPMSLQGGHTCAVSVWDSLPPGAAQPSARQPMHRILIIATIVGLAAGPARAGFDEAKAAYKRGDHITAMRELRPLAEEGNTEAQTIVGAMHLTGQGVPQDYNKAASWLKRAARTGQPRAQFALGMLYTEGWGVPRDDVQAHKWLNLAASRLPPGNDLKNAVKDRDRIAKKLTPERLAEAQRLASNWRPVLDVSGLKLIATYGSGFIVSPAGHVLTHADVVDRCRAITASVDPKGRSNPQFDKRPLKLVAIDAGYDLAVLESAAPVASLARFRSEPSVRTGETVVVAGLPPFSDLNVTTGESSGTLDLGNNVNLIQITASVLPSNSGGPLLDASGNVVGVVAR